MNLATLCFQVDLPPGLLKLFSLHSFGVRWALSGFVGRCRGSLGVVLMSSYWERDLATRGGARQRDEGSRLLGAQARQPCKLANCLLQLFGWGLISANTVQWLAAAAYSDGLRHPLMEDLAKIGTSGLYAGNARRDLLRKFLPTCPISCVFFWDVPLLVNGAVTSVRTLLIPPSELIGAVWANFKGAFKDMFGHNVREFWRQVPADDPKRVHLERLLAGEGDWECKTDPYVLHGDAARFTTKGSESILTVQIKGLLAQSFGVSILPIFAVAKKVLAADSAKIL